MNQQPNYLVSLDLGNTATRVLVAELSDSNGEAGPLRFRGLGEVPSQGWRKGTIADLEQVAGSVRKAVGQAEAMAGVPVESAIVGIGGPHVEGLSSWAGLNLSIRPREVTREDIRRVMEAARDIPLARDREILHMVPEEFLLDSQEGIRDPLGLRGSRLAVKVHIMSGLVTAAQNVVAAVNRAGVLVETLVQEAFAVGELVLSPEERELGTLVVVLGGGGSEMVAYRHGSLRMSAVVPIGGDHFTSDVAVGLHVSHPNAEIVKKTFGSVLPAGSHDGASFEAPGMGNRPPRLIPYRMLLEILEPRAQELLGFALEEVRRCGLDQQLGAGVVLSGGGARLHGMCDLAERIFGVPARLGLPPKITDLPETLDTPEYATVIGLLLYGQRVRRLRAAPHPVVGRHWKNLLTGKK